MEFIMAVFLLGEKKPNTKFGNRNSITMFPVDNRINAGKVKLSCEILYELKDLITN